MSWEIEPGDGGYCSLHNRLEWAPRTAASVAGPGWIFVISGLRKLLESGAPLA